MKSKNTFKIKFVNTPKAKRIASHLNKSLPKFLSPCLNSEPDYLFSIGGDGTFIKHAIEYNYEKTKIIGINGGNLGFYSSFSEKNLNLLIKNLSKLHFEKIDLLHIKQNHNIWLGINELAIISSTAFPLKIYFDDIFYQRFRGTGILVSTRTGSTGYIKSAKGAIIAPQIECLEFVELQPLLQVGFITIQSPLILPVTTKIKIIPEKKINADKNICRIFLDGVEINNNFSSNFVEVKSIKSKAKFLLPNTLEAFINKLQKTFIKG